MKRIAITLCLALLALIPVDAVLADGVQTILGETTALSPTFTRPGGGVVRYQAQSFYLPVAGNCYFYGTQNYDGYLHIYGGSFNPALPATNLLGSDDDGDLGVGTSQVGPLALNAGNYVVVNDAFAGGIGTYQTSIQCDGASQPLVGPCQGTIFTGIPVEQNLCLNNRFLVAIDQISNSTTGGIGTPVRVSSNDTGIFWFYYPSNFEVMLKVLNGCGINNSWWVFAGSLTNQSYRIRVADVQNLGAGIRTYTNTFPNPAAAITDTSAFATCP